MAGHDSSVSIVYPGGPTIYNIRTSSLPYITLAWTSEDALVAAGHDCQPVVFAGSEQGWALVGTLDGSTSGSSKGPGAKAGTVGRLNSAAFNTFRNADTRGQSGGDTASDTELLTVHQNTILSVRPFAYDGEGVSRVSTTGVDGKLVIWDVNAVTALAGKMGGLRV